MGREDFGYCSDDPNYLKLIGVVVGKNTDAKREKTLLIYSEMFNFKKNWNVK